MVADTENVSGEWKTRLYTTTETTTGRITTRSGLLVCCCVVWCGVVVRRLFPNEYSKSNLTARCSPQLITHNNNYNNNNNNNTYTSTNYTYHMTSKPSPLHFIRGHGSHSVGGTRPPNDLPKLKLSQLVVGQPSVKLVNKNPMLSIANVVRSMYSTVIMRLVRKDTRQTNHYVQCSWVCSKCKWPVVNERQAVSLSNHQKYYCSQNVSHTSQ